MTGEKINVNFTLSGVYLRRLCRRNAYVNKGEFSEWYGKQDSSSLAWTLEILSTLAQSKAYLYWCRDWEAV